MPAEMAACSTEVPLGTVTWAPSIVSVTCSMAVGIISRDGPRTGLVRRVEVATGQQDGGERRATAQGLAARLQARGCRRRNYRRDVRPRCCAPPDSWCFALLLTLGGVAPAWAQSEAVRTDARAAAIAGRRAEAVEMLETHLETFPRDADARLLLGVVLSWDGKYDDADRELRRVLEQSPTYNDARVALANVAWWTGRYDVLQELAATGRAPAAVRRRVDHARGPRARRPGPAPRGPPGRDDAAGPPARTRAGPVAQEPARHRAAPVDRSPWATAATGSPTSARPGTNTRPRSAARRRWAASSPASATPSASGTPTGCSRSSSTRASGPAPTASSRTAAPKTTRSSRTTAWPPTSISRSAAASRRRSACAAWRSAPPPTSTWARSPNTSATGWSPARCSRCPTSRARKTRCRSTAWCAATSAATARAS